MEGCSDEGTLCAWRIRILAGPARDKETNTEKERDEERALLPLVFIQVGSLEKRVILSFDKLNLVIRRDSSYTRFESANAIVYFVAGLV